MTLIQSIKTHLRKFTMLCVSLARPKQHDTRILTSMDDYKINFDLDSKIAWNRHRMRELFEMYKKIENYYTLFFAFLGFIGIYYFDFIILLINNFNHWFLLTTTLTTLGLVWSLYYMIRIIFTNDWKHDIRPKDIYIKSFDDWTVYLKKQETFNENELDKNVREAYLTALEQGYDINFKIYNTKKNYIANVLKIIVISLIMYSINIVHFKQIKIMLDEKPQTNLPGVKEGEIKNSKPLLTDRSDNSELRKLVRQEINLYFQEQKDKHSKELIDKNKRLSNPRQQ